VVSSGFLRQWHYISTAVHSKDATATQYSTMICDYRQVEKYNLYICTDSSIVSMLLVQ